VHNVNKEQVVISFLLNPYDLGISSLQAESWGIDKKMFIGLTITFYVQQGQEEKAPKIECYQCGNTKSEGESFSNKKKFLLYWSVATRVQDDFLKIFFPFEKIQDMKEKGKEESFFKSLYEFVESTISSCNDHCLICGKKVKYPGLKPTVCLKKLCLFTHEQFGLGVDLETEIMDHGDILDLLISFAYSAAVNNQNSNFDTFIPFPSGVEVKTKNKKGKEITYDFLNGEKNDHQKVADVINKIPEIKKLQEFIKKRKI